jgi:hypothetical protein
MTTVPKILGRQVHAFPSATRIDPDLSAEVIVLGAGVKPPRFQLRIAAGCAYG